MPYAASVLRACQRQSSGGLFESHAAIAALTLAACADAASAVGAAVTVSLTFKRLKACSDQLTWFQPEQLLAEAIAPHIEMRHHPLRP